MEGIKNITYKLQGKGTSNEVDSWIIFYKDPEKIPDIVYEDPSKQKKLDISNIDLTTMSKEQIAQLKELLK